MLFSAVIEVPGTIRTNGRLGQGLIVDRKATEFICTRVAVNWMKGGALGGGTEGF